MLRIDVPGWRALALEHLVLDLNGTLAVDGALLSGVGERLGRLSADLTIHMLTADTRGLAGELARELPLAVRVIGPTAQDAAKRDFVLGLGAASCAAMGNGANDRLMLAEAALGVAVLQAEGAAAGALAAADAVCSSLADALDLLLIPQRLIATLRR